MSYTCVSFSVDPPEPGSEILSALLCDISFESFVTNPKGLEAYIPDDVFDEANLKELLSSLEGFKVDYEIQKIEKQNWNAEWEKNFEPVVIENYAVIRASFHSPPAPPALDVVIEPKMSFGTGHHQTTRLMSKSLFEMPVKVSLLDVGCGTGVLAIISKLIGYQSVKGIDIDEWSIENSRENRKMNGYDRHVIDFMQGTIGSLEEHETFDVLLANINKNILLKEMSHYVKHLNLGGSLLLSGFFQTDCDELIAAARQAGLNYISTQTKNEWAVLHFERE